VDLSNLNRQILFNTNDIGKFKVVQAKKFVKNINAKINISIYKEKINLKNIKKIINKFDIICDCTDNFYSRYLINDFCVKTKKILISSAINKYDGHIFNFDFRKNIPCYRCFMPEIPYIENKCDSEGLMPTVAGVAGTIHANEVIKSILQIKSDLVGSMMVFDALDLKFRKVKLSKNPRCLANCKKK
jgi:adenylyltransferase/sulfurtransferase